MSEAAALRAGAGRSDIGRVRSRNEDSILLRPAQGLWAVADGLGGHASGDYASQSLVGRLASAALPEAPAQRLDVVDELAAAISAELQALAQARRGDLIGTTLVAALDLGPLFAIGWVGDSRAYAWRAGALAQLGSDHAVGSEALLRGFRPGALTRAIGADATVQVEWTLVAAEPGLRLLLCSDGITKELDDAALAERFAALAGAGPDALVERLIGDALAAGGHDNCSAVVVDAGPQPVLLPEPAALQQAVRELRRFDRELGAGRLDHATLQRLRRDLLAPLLAPSASPSAPGWRRWLPWPR